MLQCESLCPGLNGSIGTEEAAYVQHAGIEALADEVAGVVNGDAVRRRAMTSHDEDPLETVLRDLCADIRNQRSEGGVTDAIGAWVDEVAADFVRSGLTVMDGRHHHHLPLRQRRADPLRHAGRLVLDAERI